MRRLLLTCLAAVLWVPAAVQAGIVPSYGGGLRVALPAAPEELHPARASMPSDLAVVRALHATLLEVDAAGALRPGLLAALPEVEPGGRAFRLRLRPDLRFHDGSPLTAANVAASLARLLSPQVRSPYGWVVLPIDGSEAVREGQADALAGVQILSDTELRVVLSVPLPEFPWLLATLPTAILARNAPVTVGAGPFWLVESSGDTWRLAAFDGHHRGRPFLDTVTFSVMDGRRAARAFSQGELDLALRPEALGSGGNSELPALTATYAVMNRARLGSQAETVRRALGAIDRAELVRLYVGEPAVPLRQLVPVLRAAADRPSPREDHAAAGSGSRPGAPALRPPGLLPLAAPPRLVLLVPSGPPSLRPVSERIQVKLFDSGLRVSVQRVSPDGLAARLAARDFDLALTSVGLVSDRPALATLQLAWALGGPAAGRRALVRMGDAAAPPPSPSLEEELGAVPLFVRGWRASARPEVQGTAVTPEGGVDLGDVWLLPLRAPR